MAKKKECNLHIYILYDGGRMYRYDSSHLQDGVACNVQEKAQTKTRVQPPLMSHQSLYPCARALPLFI